jgi:DNA adenine methylase
MRSRGWGSRGLAQPFLKWAGGKRWAAPDIVKKIGDIKGTYFEPFVGSGAVFFELQPKRAVLSDLNCKLIECYNNVKDNYEKLVKS